MRNEKWDRETEIDREGVNERKKEKKTHQWQQMYSTHESETKETQHNNGKAANVGNVITYFPLIYIEKWWKIIITPRHSEWKFTFINWKYTKKNREAKERMIEGRN